MPADIPKNLSAITELQNYRITELSNRLHLNTVNLNTEWDRTRIDLTKGKTSGF
ncbi:hypothetical protein (plasmid) [Erwinia amylovora ATCC 49946]|uniref:hypothetical protein n=1 Tax=Erwinia amylovora TaxID=552 RepID=UPI0001CCB7DC|nr:hypothetical protein [Erwinia amylovora]CBJ48198.1 hypothetical protein [Erwinia amylovora ATCC 49946]